MTKRVVLIGPPGCGKSTLAAQLFMALKADHKNAELVDEFIRRDIQQHGPMQSIWEQYRTRAKQKEIEDAIPAAVEWAICDSGTLSPYFYACLYADHSDARQRLALRDLHAYLLDDLYLKRYDAVLFLSPVAGINVDDGTRYQTPEQIRLLADHMSLAITRLYRIGNAHCIDGAFDGRFAKAMAVITALQ